MSVKVQNRPAYEARLRRCGSLTSWTKDGTLEDRQTCGPGGQARYTDAGIQSSLILRTALQTAVAADRRPDSIDPQADGSDSFDV